jgi:large repetitive protein
MRQHRTSSILCTLALLLAACGNSNPSSSANLPPQASALLESGTALGKAGYVSPNEALTFASSDADGNVAKVKWVIDAGQPLERSGEYTGNTVSASIPFALPSLNSGLHTMTLTVTDNSAAVTNSVTSFKVDALAPIISSVSVNGAPLADGQVLSLASTDAATLKVTATDSRGGGDASASPTTVAVYVGDTLLKAGSAPLSYDLELAKLLTATTTVQTIRVVAVDSVMNGTVRSFTIQTATTTPPQEKQPTPVLSVVGSNPHSGNMSVNISGNFDSKSEVGRLILQITDSKGVIDNSTYTSTQAQATFSIDTTKLANGDLMNLKVIAYTKSGLKGETDHVGPITISNINSPLFSVAAPADGATVTTPLVPVKVTLTTRGTSYTNPTQLLVDVLDSRGKIALTKTLTAPAGGTLATAPECTGDDASLTCNLEFDMAGLPADTYTVRARSVVTVAGEASARSLETSSRFTSNTASVLPPAATIRFPAITNLRTVGRVDSSSGILVNVSDDTGVAVVEARLVGPFDATTPLSLNGTSQCLESVPVGKPVDVLLLNYGLVPPVLLDNIFVPSLDIDGSAYVPDNLTNQRYDLRVTTIDTEKNRNIQCIPVTIDRLATRRDRINYSVVTTTTPGTPDLTPGKLNYTAGSWTISNLQNNSRVASVLYINNVKRSVGFAASTNTSDTVSLNFADEGTYQVVWLVEDMQTGIVTTRPGAFVNVKKNPS